MSTTTTRLGLTKPAVGETAWGAPLNANLDTLDAIETLTGLLVSLAEVPSSTLRVKVWGGTFRSSSGAAVAYAGAVLTLSASATTYIWLTDAGAPTTGLAWPGTAYTPLAVVTTDGTKVTSIVCSRVTCQAIGSASASTVAAHKVLVGPLSGPDDVPAYRLLDPTDIPSLPASIIGSGTLAVARLPVMVGSGASHAAGIVPDPGASAGTTKYLREDGTWQVPPGSGSGISSVDLTMPGSVFSVSGGPITSSGVLAVAFQSQGPNLFLASPDGSTGAPGFRAISATDLPTSGVAPGTYNTVTVDSRGRVLSGSSGGTGGTVTSVGATVPTDILAVSGVPITGAGTIAVTKVNQAANAAFLGPTSGGPAAPAFRALVVADIPDLSGVYSIKAGNASIATVGTVTAGTWQAAPVAIAYGGTGQATATAAFDALSPMTALGDLIYGGASGTRTRLAGNTAATRNFLRQLGTGSASAAPAWDTLQAADLPTSPVTPGSYTNANLTVDAYGRVLAASSGSAGGPTYSTLSVASSVTSSVTAVHLRLFELNNQKTGSNNGWAVSLTGPASAGAGTLVMFRIVASASNGPVAITAGTSSMNEGTTYLTFTGNVGDGVTLLSDGTNWKPIAFTGTASGQSNALTSPPY